MDKVCYSKIISSLHTLEEVSQGEWVVFTQVLIYLVTSFSYLRYRNEIWGSLSDTKLDQLQHLQDRARTLIENAHSKDGWVCNWLSVINFDNDMK